MDAPERRRHAPIPAPNATVLGALMRANGLTGTHQVIRWRLRNGREGKTGSIPIELVDAAIAEQRTDGVQMWVEPAHGIRHACGGRRGSRRRTGA
jgi:hypothetical protein